jgi:WD40 repeat protein
MSKIAKYIVFIVFLVAVVYVAVNPTLPYAYPLSGQAGILTRITKNQAAEIPAIAYNPSCVLGGLQNAGAVDFRGDKNLTATGEEGRIKLWRLPAEQPVLEIDAGPEFQILQVRFLPGKEIIAGCGLTADGKGSIRIFNVATGKQTFQIDNEEPVIYMDFDQSGRYLAGTGMSQIKVWDLAANQTVAIFPRNSAGARGVFFREDRYILQSDTLSLYDWKNRKQIAGLDNVGVVDLKKINNNLCAWLSINGLHTVRSPYGKREFVPFNAQGIYAFDLAPDGKWGLFLREDRTMALIDGETGLTVRTVRFKLRPDGVFIHPDGASASVSYREGKIEVFDIGNENIFRNAKFYTTRFFTQLGNKIGAVTKKVTPTDGKQSSEPAK